jgi:hypothetical protein
MWRFFTIAAAALLLPLSTGSTENNNDAALIPPLETAAYDWYNLGELFAASRSFEYNRALADHLDEVYAPLRDLLSSVGASPDTIGSFCDWLTQLKRLPWKQPLSNWPRQDQITWQSALEEQRFTASIEKEAAKTPQSRFFLLLGARTEELVWAVLPAAKRNLPVVVNALIKRAGRDFRLLVSDQQFEPFFGQLSPEVQEAIKAVNGFADAEFGDEDPKAVNAEPLSLEEIQHVVDAGNLIRQSAKMKTLLLLPHGKASAIASLVCIKSRE